MTKWVNAVGDEARVEYGRLDSRLMGKPEKFAVQDALLLDWKFQIEAYFGFLVCLEPLQTAELETNPVTVIGSRQSHWKRRRVNHISFWPPPHLKQCCTSLGALPTDADSKHGEDFACDTSQPLGTGASHSLNRVIEPDLRGGEFIDKLQIWENDFAKYSAATEEVLGERILISVLTKNADTPR